MQGMRCKLSAVQWGGSVPWHGKQASTAAWSCCRQDRLCESLSASVGGRGARMISYMSAAALASFTPAAVESGTTESNCHK